MCVCLCLCFSFLTPALTHTDGRFLPALCKYVYAAFMQAQSNAQCEKATELLQQIISDAHTKGLLGSTNWAAKPLPKLAESDESDKAESGGW